MGISQKKRPKFILFSELSFYPHCALAVDNFLLSLGLSTHLLKSSLF